ncbi:MAG: GNAT family N-acetyltransferase [Planctomycetes bacterium]|nr:GNAT family N-acetyltransferase [Planctomycetota bacterium]
MPSPRPVPERDVLLRVVVDGDLELFFEHQADPIACGVAGFESRARDAFFAHWAKVRANPDGLVRAVLAGDELVGNVVSWGPEDERLVGYWIGREHWNRSIATRALAAFLAIETRRPLFAHVARANVASQRVLAKCGFVEQRGEASAEELVYRLDGPHEPARATDALAVGR